MAEDRKRLLIAGGVLIGILLLCTAVAATAVFLVRQFTEAATPTPPAGTPGRGVVITAVQPGSPAAQTGLMPGYLILALNEWPINDVATLAEQVEAAPAGSEVALLYRDQEGLQHWVTIVKGSRPPYLGVTVTTNGVDRQSTPTNMPEDQSQATSSGEAVPSGEWATIYGIVPGSPAAAADLRIGDIVTAVDDQVVLTANELILTLQEQSRGADVTLTLRRGPETLTRTATLAPHPDDPERGFLGIELKTATP